MSEEKAFAGPGELEFSPAARPRRQKKPRTQPRTAFYAQLATSTGAKTRTAARPAPGDVEAAERSLAKFEEEAARLHLAPAEPAAEADVQDLERQVQALLRAKRTTAIQLKSAEEAETFPPYVEPFAGREGEIAAMLAQTDKEVEVALGAFYGNAFRPGLLAPPQLSLLKERLTFIFANGVPPSRPTEEASTVWIDADGNRRIEAGREVTFEHKLRARDVSVADERWGLRAAVSAETRVEDIPRFRPVIRRQRRRTSFAYNEGLSVDLTVVQTTHERGRVATTYEVEIERKPGFSVELDDFLYVVRWVLTLLELVPSDLPVVSMDRRAYAARAFGRLFAEDAKAAGFREPDPFRLPADFGNQPTTLAVKDLMPIAEAWAVTLKLDGTRAFLFVDQAATFLVLPPYRLAVVGAGSLSLAGTVLDGEFVPTLRGKLVGGKFIADPEAPPERRLYCFDLVFYQGRDMRGFELSSRLDVLAAVLRQAPADADKLVLMAKQFETEGSLYDRANAAFAQASELEGTDIGTDGLILQPPGTYFNAATRKWKPLNQLTIDFLLAPSAEPDVYLPEVATGRGQTAVFPAAKTVRVEGGLLRGEPVAGRVVECEWAPEGLGTKRGPLSPSKSAATKSIPTLCRRPGTSTRSSRTPWTRTRSGAGPAP